MPDSIDTYLKRHIIYHPNTFAYTCMMPDGAIIHVGAGTVENLMKRGEASSETEAFLRMAPQIKTVYGEAIESGALPNQLEPIDEQIERMREIRKLERWEQEAVQRQQREMNVDPAQRVWQAERQQRGVSTAWVADATKCWQKIRECWIDCEKAGYDQEEVSDILYELIEALIKGDE